MKLNRGICKVCACTDDEGCQQGCSWTDTGRTLCSACKPLGAKAREGRRKAALESLAERLAIYTDMALDCKARMRAIES